ncbi:MAG: tyrosine-protein phosphatase [Synergistaceae bacterium]|nr:tyrosine-protein phosphatase [Synergistaceae bacterium]
MKKFAVFIILFALVSSGFAGEKFSISHQANYGGVIINGSIENFNSSGFELGDSVNIEFSNGEKFIDVPYHNGYYVKIGELILTAYPGRENVWLQRNYGSDLWQDLNLSESDSVTISLNQRGKYKTIQETRALHYTNKRAHYSSDEVFANFRAINLGCLKKNYIYTSASPCDNGHNRAVYVDNLAKQAGIKCILDLADSDSEIKDYMSKSDFNSPYFKTLYDNKCVIAIDLTANFHNIDFRKKLAAGLAELSKHEGPYLIHCLEGKDRTGFTSIIIGMLAGASYNEIENNYMLSYANYYGLTRENDPQKYNIIAAEHFAPMINFIAQDENINTKSDNNNFAKYAGKFLLDSGMTEPGLNALKSRILE